MKRHLINFSLLLALFALGSCATSKEARTYKKSINGNWLLQTVTTEGIKGKVKIELFNEADFNCFVGSTWSFNNTNSLGTYSISNTNECVGIKRNIRWTIYEAKGEPKLLQFKRLDDKLKAMDDGNGFRFTIVEIDKNTMKLRSDVPFENGTAGIIYNFVKN